MAVHHCSPPLGRLDPPSRTSGPPGDSCCRYRRCFGRCGRRAGTRGGNRSGRGPGGVAARSDGVGGDAACRQRVAGRGRRRHLGNDGRQRAGPRASRSCTTAPKAFCNGSRSGDDERDVMSLFNDPDDVVDALRAPATTAELADQSAVVELMANACLATAQPPARRTSMTSLSRRTRVATMIAAGVIGFGGVAAAGPGGLDVLPAGSDGTESTEETEEVGTTVSSTTDFTTTTMAQDPAEGVDEQQGVEVESSEGGGATGRGGRGRGGRAASGACATTPTRRSTRNSAPRTRTATS